MICIVSFKSNHTALSSVKWCMAHIKPNLNTNYFNTGGPWKSSVHDMKSSVATAKKHAPNSSQPQLMTTWGESVITDNTTKL